MYLIGFLEGAGAHCLDLVRGGIHVYASSASVPLQVFFVSLVLLDPLIVVLVGLVRPDGIRLAASAMTVDVIANWIVNWPQLQEDPAWLLRPVGLLPITLFGLFVIVSSVPLTRAMRRTHGHLSCTPRGPSLRFGPLEAGRRGLCRPRRREAGRSLRVVRRAGPGSECGSR